MLGTLVDKINTYVSHPPAEHLESSSESDGEQQSCLIVDGGKTKRCRKSLDSEEYVSAPKRPKLEPSFVSKLSNIGSRMAEWFVHGKNYLFRHWELTSDPKSEGCTGSGDQLCYDNHIHSNSVQCLHHPSTDHSRLSSQHNSGEAELTLSSSNSNLKESLSISDKPPLYKQRRDMFIYKKGTQNKAFQKSVQPRWKLQPNGARINGGHVPSPQVLSSTKLYSVPVKPWKHGDVSNVKFKQQMSTAEQYIRLEEKERYALLLRQCTSSANYPGNTSSSSSFFQSSRSQTSPCTERPSRIQTVRDVASVIAGQQPAVTTSDSDPDRSPLELPPLHKRLSFSDTDTSQYSENSPVDLDTNSSSEEKISSKQSSENLSSLPSSNMKTIKILNEHWMEDLLSKFSASNLEMKRIEEEQKKVKSLEEQRKSREHQVQLEIQRRLKLIQNEAPVIPEPDPELEIKTVTESKKPLVPKISEVMRREIDSALRPYPAEDVLVDAFRIQLKRQDMATLSGLTWLNDAVINFYMCMLMERSNEPGYSKAYAFNTFFYPKLLSSKYEGVRRWTRKVDIFANKYLIIPIHLEMHWCLAVVNFQNKTICYYDSIGGKNTQCLETIKNYLCEESLDKKNVAFDLTGWTTTTVKNIPHQMNGSDCGMFACKYADYISRELPITFTQADMPTFRRLMVYEILKKKLLT
ncbi:sentrin-specific protease 1-like [Argonauta hians]